MSVGTIRNAGAAPSDSRAQASACLPWKLKLVLHFCLVPCQGMSAEFPGELWHLSWSQGTPPALSQSCLHIQGSPQFLISDIPNLRKH